MQFALPTFTLAVLVAVLVASVDAWPRQSKDVFLDELTREVKTLLETRNINKGTLKACCNNGYIAYEGACYYFGKTEMDFATAKTYCEQQGGHIVDIYSKEENDFIKERMQEHGKGFYWIGLTDIAKEGEWKWNNTCEIPQFTDWYPNDPGKEDCAYINLSWKWGDRACTAKCHPICKASGEPTIVAK